MTHSEIEKVFPEYYTKFTLPEQAQEQNLQVYRACRSGRIDQESFRDSYAEAGCPEQPEAECDPTLFSMSVYTKAKELRRFCAIDSKYRPPFLMAKGNTTGCCGVCCLTSVWKEASPFVNTKKRSTHVDWWLYTEAKPWEHFEEVNYETETGISEQSGEQSAAAGSLL